MKFTMVIEHLGDDYPNSINTVGQFKEAIKTDLLELLSDGDCQDGVIHQDLHLNGEVVGHWTIS